MHVIAIDGPAGSGKSTLARAIATRTGLDHLDTGAMYRSVALAVLRRGIDPADAAARIASQATDEQRRAVADVVLDNSGTPEELAAQVDRFWSERVVPALRS